MDWAYRRLWERLATYAQVSFTQMKIHWWQGKIEVHQIKVRDTYTVERLECRIPWRHLFSVPTKLKLEGVSILRPKASEANETKGVAAVSAAAAAGAAAGAAAAEAKKNAKEIPQQVSGWPRKQRKLVIDDLVGKWLSIVDVRIENMSVDIGHEGSKLTIQNCHTVPLCYPFITSAKQDLSRELRIENISYDNWFRMPQSKTVIIGTWDGIRIDFKVSSLEARNIPRGIFTIQKHSSSSPTIAVMGTPIALSLDVAQMHTSIDDFTPELKLSGASVKLYVSHGPTKLSVACQDIQLLDSDAKCPPWSIQNVSYQPTQDLLSIRTVNIVQPLLWIPTLTEIGRFFATSSASPSDSRVVTATKLGQAAHSRPLAGKLMIDRLIVKHEQWSLEMENAMFVLKSKMFSFDTIQLLVAAPSVSISHLDQKHSTGKQVGPPIWSKLQKHDTLMALKHGMVLVKEWPISFVGQESDSSLLLKGGSEETTVLVEETSAWNLFLEGLALQSNLEDVRKFERIWTQDPHVTFRLKELLVTASQFNYRRLQYELVPSLRSFYNKTTASVKVDPFRAKSVATPFSNYHIRIAKVQIELEQLPLISSQEINRYFLLGVGSHPYLCFRGRSLTLQTGAQSAMVASSSMQTDTENVASELTRSVQTDPMVDRWHAVIFGGNSRNNLYKQRVGIWLDQLQWQCTSEAIQKWVAIPAFFQPPSGLVVPTLPVHSTTNEFSLHKTLDHVAGKSMYCFLHISKCNVMLAKRMYRIHVPVMSASSMILPETDAPLSACIRTDIQLLDHNDHILAEASNMDCLACIRPKGQWDLKFQRKTGAGVALALSKFQVETMIEQLAIYTRTNSTPARAAADAADTKDTRAQLFAPPSPGQDNYFASLKPSMEDDLVSGDSSLLFYDDVIRIEDEYLVDSNVSIPVALGAVAPATLAERKATVAAETARSRDEQLTVGWYAPPLIVDNHLARVFPHEDANDVATLPTVVNGKEQLSKFLLPDTIPMQAIGLADWKCSVRLLDESRKCFARAEGVGVNIEWRKWGETSQWITCRVQSLDLIDECVSSNYNKVLTCWVGFRDEKQRPLHFVQPASAPMLQWEILQQPSSNNSPHDMRRVVESNTIVSVAGSAGQPAIVELAPSVEQKNQELYSSGLSVKVKIAPLRLHLHQDFLHQILQFQQFNIQLPQVHQHSQQTETRTVTPPPSQTCIQHFQCSSLAVSLDYKYINPKISVTAQKIDLVLPALDFVALDNFGVLLDKIRDHWLAVATKHQYWKLLVSVQPFRSLSKIVVGTWSLIAIPWQQWRENQGRMVTGVKRGVYTFCDQVVGEGLDLTARVSGIAKSALRFVHRSVTPAIPIRGTRAGAAAAAAKTAAAQAAKENKSLPRRLPANYEEGFSLAKQQMGAQWQGMGAQAHHTQHLFRHQGWRGASVHAISSLPSHLISPLVAVTEAVQTASLGMVSSLQASKKRELLDKYKGLES